MAGMIRVPTTAESATAEPFIPAKIMLTTTLTWASPPRIRPTSSRLRSTRRSVILPWFINSPVSRKKGMAMSGAFEIDSYIW